MTQLSTHILADLESQRKLLLDEFAVWRQRSEQVKDLAQHRSQIERVVDTLDGVLRAALADGPLRVDRSQTPPATSLDAVIEVRRILGSVHLLWDFFRDKFAQRDTGLFSDHLGAADDLAWTVYQKFLNVSVEVAESAVGAGQSTTLRPEELKEAPLVFYSPERSPFAQARASAFRPPGLSEKDVDMFRRALLRLPVPIIGFPWPQARSMPALVFVGHEVGHVVAEDLGLAGRFDALLEGLGLPDDRPKVWRAWADEVFADIFGVLVSGSAYVDRLIRLLADDLSAIRTERIRRDRPGSYPSRALRVALCRQVQERLGLAPHSTWTAMYGAPSGDSGAFVEDIPAIVQALIEGPYPELGGQALDSILPWTAVHDAQAKEVAECELAKVNHDIDFSIRIWIAAAVQAQVEDASKYASGTLDLTLAKQIVAERKAGVRSDDGASLRDRLFALEEPVAGPLGLESAGASLPNLDRRAGRRLADLLTF